MQGLHVDDGGRGGVPVVLHHGLGADLEVWRAQIEHLRGTRRVLAFDMRGHGRSPRAPEYTVAGCVEDLIEVTKGLPRFWLVGHSFGGTILTELASRHPERLHGLVYVDAVGDASDPPAEIREYFRSRDADMTPARLQEAYEEMLGPLARPRTREHILRAAARMHLPAFAALRASMLEVGPPVHFPGPKFAVEAAGMENPRSGSKLPGAKLRTIANVSHWLMLDAPGALNEILDEVLR
jgi:pimeloyl-ACP methyl ester carboxylesterase